MRRGGVGVVQPGRVVRRFVEQRAACDSLVETGAVVFVLVINGSLFQDLESSCVLVDRTPIILLLLLWGSKLLLERGRHL